MTGKKQDNKRKFDQELKRVSDSILTQFFSIIYCSYRKGFKPLLSENKEIRAYVECLIVEKNLS